MSIALLYLTWAASVRPFSNHHLTIYVYLQILIDSSSLAPAFWGIHTYGMMDPNNICTGNLQENFEKMQSSLKSHTTEQIGGIQIYVHVNTQICLFIYFLLCDILPWIPTK